MGITGLLEVLRDITKPILLNELAGKRIGIDAMCWLHKGAYSCSRELALNLETQKYITYFMNFIKSLQALGVVDLLVVFDGMKLPSKALTDEKRRASRAMALQSALASEAAGNSSKALTHFQRGVNINAEMIRGVMDALQQEGIPFMTAAYEADAQLAQLSRSGLIDVVLTEDSDTIAYACPHVVFKASGVDGTGQLIEYDDLSSCESLTFRNWSQEKFIIFCVLSGCDYCHKVPSVGIKTAYKIVSKYKSVHQVLRYLADRYFITEEHQTEIYRAVLTFQHQTVFDPETHCMCPLMPIPETLHLMPTTDLSFLGPILSDDTINSQLMQGMLNPRTLQPFSTNAVENHAPSVITAKASSSYSWSFGEVKAATAEPDQQIMAERTSNSCKRRDHYYNRQNKLKPTISQSFNSHLLSRHLTAMHRKKSNPSIKRSAIQLKDIEEDEEGSFFDEEMNLDANVMFPSTLNEQPQQQNYCERQQCANIQGPFSFRAMTASNAPVASIFTNQVIDRLSIDRSATPPLIATPSRYEDDVTDICQQKHPSIGTTTLWTTIRSKSDHFISKSSSMQL